jgi:hypothetical protein
MRRTSGPTPFRASRMRTPRGRIPSLWSLHRTVSTSDVPFVTRRHTRVGFRIRPICSPGRILRFTEALRCEVDLRARGHRFVLPVRARRAQPENVFHRIENLQAETRRPHEGCLVGRSFTRALFRLLPIRAPRQAVLRTSSWLAPFRVTNRSCDLPVGKTRNASNRCLPPNRTACTRTSCVPGSARHFRGGEAPRRLRLRAAGPGDRTFHDVR